MMEAWAKILSGIKTHGLVLVGLGAVIAMRQAETITGWSAVYLGCLIAAFSTVRFALANGGTKE